MQQYPELDVHTISEAKSLKTLTNGKCLFQYQNFYALNKTIPYLFFVAFVNRFSCLAYIL